MVNFKYVWAINGWGDPFKFAQWSLDYNVARNNLKSIYVTREFGINLRMLHVWRGETGEEETVLFSSSCPESPKKKKKKITWSRSVPFIPIFSP